MKYYTYIFFLTSISSITITFDLKADDRIDNIKVNGNRVVASSPDKDDDKRYFGTFDANERDILHIGIGNDKGSASIYGKISFGSHMFFRDIKKLHFDMQIKNLKMIVILWVMMPMIKTV